MKRAYIDIPEGQVHYRTEGSGIPILLLHQTPFSSVEYSEVIPILGKSYRVLAMDTLGFGYSDPPPEHFEIEDYARSIVHFLDAMQIKKTNVVGHHTGSTLATELAASYPKRVDKLVLSGSSLYTPEKRKEYQDNPRYAPMVITEDGSFLKGQWEYCQVGAVKMTKEIAYKRFVACMLAGPRLHDAHHAAFRYEKDPKLPMIKSPTLVMYGSQDFFIGKLDIFKRLIPRCRTRVIEGAGNLSLLEKPDEVASAILQFIENPGV